jgi:hypothetical protein
MTDFCVRSFSALCTYIRTLVINTDHEDMGYSDGRWMVLANDPVEWWALV